MSARTPKLKVGELVMIQDTSSRWSRKYYARLPDASKRPITRTAYEPDEWNGDPLSFSHKKYVDVDCYAIALLVRIVKHNIQYSLKYEKKVLAEILVGEKLVHIPLRNLRRPWKDRAPYYNYKTADK